MMSRGFMTVLKMHLKQQMLSKAFIWSTLLLPVLMVAVGMIQNSLANLNGIEPSHVIIASEDAQLLEAVQPLFAARDEVANGIYTLEYANVGADELEAFVESKRTLIMADSNNGLFYVPASALDDKGIAFYSTNVGNQVLRQNVTRVFNETLNRLFFADRVAQSDIDYAVKPLAITGLRVSASGEETGSAGNYAVGFGLAILLMISMIGIVSPFSAAVIEEKTNRAVEVLLTSVSPKELLAGKIAARTITGTAQMLIWLLPLILVMTNPMTLMMLPPGFSVDVSFGTLLFFIANYVMGVTIMLAIWGGFSAMFDSTQDAGNTMWPVMMLMWVPFYAVFALLRNPANSVATILSITPFTSLYVMPFRMLLVDVPPWQPLLALGVNAAILYGAVVAGGKIYRISVLATGQQPTLKQFMAWLRQPG